MPAGPEGPGAGDSTGYALVPPKLRERPAILPPPDGLSGNVLLLVEVLENGRVGKIVISRSSGSKVLDESARENVARWRFDPAWEPQGKKPARVLTSVWVRYAKEGS
jgi:protein TonB